MMGTKKLAEIKQELGQMFGSADKDFQAWLEQTIAAQRRKSAEDLKVVEDLLWVQKILREAVAAKTSHPKKARKRKPKNTPAA